MPDESQTLIAAMTKEQIIDQLAEYFTGPDVAINSVGLAVPDGPMRLAERARRFFAVRSALGIQGYDSKEEAAASISQLLTTARRAE